ncbi:MAG TPA: diphthine synthase [Thermoplasmata archaeon]|nr:diphthine synthase [Thermoplasmata archaeon]
MSVLWFVGLGLDDERGLSRRALEVLGSCEVFAEEYTAVASPGSVERLGRELGRPVRRLGRAELEQETVVLQALARASDVALVVVGDPFAATTHVALRLAAERAGHSWGYLPNASILVAAAGFLGLSHYRFGRTVSLPFPAPGFEPRSPLEQIAANRERDLHTLLLLDLAPEAERFLRADEAIAILRERDPASAVLSEDDPLAVAARVGRPEAKGFYGPVRLLRGVDFGPPLHAVVVPARRLHFEEEAALERFRVGRPA